jgi:hypothetical protein
MCASLGIASGVAARQMMNQLNNMTGEERRDEGMERVQNSGSEEEQDAKAIWMRRFRESLPGIDGTTFQAEDIITKIGEPPKPQLVGACVNALLRNKVIEKTGERAPMKKKTSNARRTDLYRLKARP